MAVDVTITEVTSGYNLGAINQNFTAIKTALLDALSLSGNTPNQMEADLDLNSNTILNAVNIDFSNIPTSASGLVVGRVYRSGTDLKVVV